MITTTTTTFICHNRKTAKTTGDNDRYEEVLTVYASFSHGRLGSAVVPNDAVC